MAAPERPGGSRARTLVLEPSLASVARARRLIQEATAGTELDDSSLAADAALVVSELVTNAVLHARTPVGVAVAVDGECVRVEVTDDSDLPVVTPGPVRAPAVQGGVFDEPDPHLDAVIEDLSTTGRGMEVVTSVAARWGVTAHADGGKTVWAEVGEPGADPSPPGRPPAPPAPPVAAGRSFTAHLVAIPVRLIHESDTNFDDALREIQVMTLGGSARPVLADLAEEANELLADVDSLRLKNQEAYLRALQRGDRLVDLHMTLDGDVSRKLASVDVFFRAVAAARSAGVLLTPLPGREVTSFRRWMRDEVLRQLAGGRLRPCQFPVLPAPGNGGDDPPAPSPLDQRRDQLLGELRSALAGAGDPASVAEVSVRRVAAATDASFVALHLVEPDGMHAALAARVGFPAGEQRGLRFALAGDNPLAEAARTARPVVMRTSEERRDRYPSLQVSSPVAANPTAVWVPLGERPPAPGVLAAGFSLARDFTDSDLQFLRRVAGVIASRLGEV